MSRGRRDERGPRRLRPAVLVWVSCALAALVLVLGTSGTLSSWTQAIIVNPTNTVTTGKAVILQETSGGVTCASSDQPSNSSSCSTINKYGGTATPLTPGPTGSQTVNVTFTNLGSSPASSFVLTPGACSSTPTTGTPTPNDLCTTTGELNVSVNCSNGAAYVVGSKWTDLTYSGVPGSMGTLTHTATIAAGATWTCQFVVSLATSASVLDQGVTVTQPLTWTLNQ